MDQVKAILNDPTLGITSAARLWEAVKENDIKVTRSQVMQLYKTQNELSARPRNRVQLSVRAPFGEVGALMADLMDVSAYASQNGNVNFILHVIDLYSKYVWSFALKNKTPGPISEHLRSVLEQVRQKHPTSVISLSTDDGTEFKGAVAKLLKEYEIHHQVSTSKNNQSPVERFNRTMWTYFRNYLRSTGKTDFIRLLPKFVGNYNNRKHSATGSKPVDIFEEHQLPKKLILDRNLVCNGQCKIVDLRKEFAEGFQVGDLVRVAYQPGRFDKKSIAFRWSETTYEIVDKVNNRFQVKRQGASEPNKTLYLPTELLKTQIERIAPVEEKDREEPQLAIEPAVAAVKKVSRTRRLQRKEPAFTDNEHKIDVFGNVTTKGRLVAEGPRQRRMREVLDL